jgi:hypothetical protein
MANTSPLPDFLKARTGCTPTAVMIKGVTDVLLLIKAQYQRPTRHPRFFAGTSSKGARAECAGSAYSIKRGVQEQPLRPTVPGFPLSRGEGRDLVLLWAPGFAGVTEVRSSGTNPPCRKKSHRGGALTKCC